MEVANEFNKGKVMEQNASNMPSNKDIVCQCSNPKKGRRVSGIWTSGVKQLVTNKLMNFKYPKSVT